jgi:hypothetical protein
MVYSFSRGLPCSASPTHPPRWLARDSEMYSAQPALARRGGGRSKLALIRSQIVLRLAISFIYNWGALSEGRVERDKGEPV